MTLQHFTGEFLTFLEQRETRLLSWGFYNTLRWTPPEIEAAFPLEASPPCKPPGSRSSTTDARFPGC